MRHSSDSSQTAPTAHPIFVTYIIIIRSIGFVVGGQLDDAIKDPDGEQRGGTLCYANVYTNRLNRALIGITPRTGPPRHQRRLSPQHTISKLCEDIYKQYWQMFSN